MAYTFYLRKSGQYADHGTELGPLRVATESTLGYAIGLVFGVIFRGGKRLERFKQSRKADPFLRPLPQLEAPPGGINFEAAKLFRDPNIDFSRLTIAKRWKSGHRMGLMWACWTTSFVYGSTVGHAVLGQDNGLGTIFGGGFAAVVNRLASAQHDKPMHLKKSFAMGATFFIVIEMLIYIVPRLMGQKSWQDQRKEAKEAAEKAATISMEEEEPAFDSAIFGETFARLSSLLSGSNEPRPSH